MDIDKAINIINNRRNLAELKVYKLKQKLREDKIFSELETKLNSLSFEIARLESLNKDTGELKEQYSELGKKYNKRLEELNAAPEDLQVKYICNKCKDTGFIGGKKCVCLKNLIYQSLKSKCGQLETDTDSFTKVKFDIIDENYEKGYVNTYKQLKKYSEKFPEVVPFLLLSGDTGVGKSFMASVLSNALMKKGFSVFYLNACELNEIFLRYHLADIYNKEAIFSPLSDCDLLVIDDLGSENFYNNVTIPYLYHLILKRRQKNTVITTNLFLNEIEMRYDKRIFSRLSDINLTRNVHIKGEDLRLVKRNK